MHTSLSHIGKGLEHARPHDTRVCEADRVTICGPLRSPARHEPIHYGDNNNYDDYPYDYFTHILIIPNSEENKPARHTHDVKITFVAKLKSYLHAA